MTKAFIKKIAVESWKIFIMSNFSFYHKPGRKMLMKAKWASSNLGGHNLHPLVDIELTNLPKSGWAIARPGHPSPTSLKQIHVQPNLVYAVHCNCF